MRPIGPWIYRQGDGPDLDKVVIDSRIKKRIVGQRERLKTRGGNLNEKIIKALATGLGSGLFPFMPGTAGTVVGIPLYLVFSTLTWPLWLLSAVAFAALAWYVADEAERLYQKKDAQCIVIDEIAGLLWTMFLVSPTPTHIVAGFLLFRLFDITKPYPARLFQERLPGGLGIVADDLAAGVYGNIVLQFLIRAFGV
jgi:phosphatidylglycerophosphatase A